MRRVAVAPVILLVSMLLSACTGNGDYRRSVNEIAPLQLEEEVLSVDQVAALAPTPDLLALDDAMREFVDRYAGDTLHGRQRLVQLHRAVRGSATLGVEYDPGAGGTAQDVFYRGSANCLSYASMFIALAREADLEANYQWLDVRPEWTREGERITVRLHVNVLVEPDRVTQYMVDIDPLEPGDIAGSRRMEDSDAQALYHSNIAMDALAGGDLGTAWVQSVRALQLAPQIAHLWVNLGAVYRAAGQYVEAERSYQQALVIDPAEHSAMNNLAVLYGFMEQPALQARWEQKVVGYREHNPYYYAWLGESAVENGEWSAAIDYFTRASEMAPQDGRLLYELGLVHLDAGQLDQAVDYLQRAVGAATLYSDIRLYQGALDRVLRDAGEQLPL